ncbi:uncharacterized protein LOC108027741 [Drosophila biarmipes]|uniref:uncharacterized protein LOC108027741 n=1 Tax=Drosophila biarmipes TaxID=125945 RepID=UPI0007E601EF|nr:uncharacterized protein LOC108027741 [Drosophila biarmipes]
MKNFIHFTDQLLTLEEDFIEQKHPLKKHICCGPKKHQEPEKCEGRNPLLNSMNFNNLYGSPSSNDDITDFEDFPDLNQPLPNISIREQYRLTSMNRGKNLSLHRNHQKRLDEIWLAQERLMPLRNETSYEGSIDVKGVGYFF